VERLSVMQEACWWGLQDIIVGNRNSLQSHKQFWPRLEDWGWYFKRLEGHCASACGDGLRAVRNTLNNDKLFKGTIPCVLGTFWANL
jgi:hypothetical protein